MGKTQRKTGFSLVEMSVVLVIVGLLIGAVMTGKNMLRAAELRKVGTNVEMFRTAANQFLNKFGYHAGDFPKATNYLSGNVSYSYAAGVATGVRNGNGSMAIDAAEIFDFWRQLAKAGMITGDYKGNYAANVMMGGENLPRSSGSIDYRVQNMTINAFPTNHMIVLQSGGYTYSSAGAGAFTVEEASNMDIKLDDGSPGMGDIWGVRASNYGATSCTTIDAWTGGDARAATYNFATTGSPCILVWQSFI